MRVIQNKSWDREDSTIGLYQLHAMDRSVFCSGLSLTSVTYNSLSVPPTCISSCVYSHSISHWPHLNSKPYIVIISTIVTIMVTDQANSTSYREHSVICVTRTWLFLNKVHFSAVDTRTMSARCWIPPIWSQQHGPQRGRTTRTNNMNIPD